MRVMVELRFVVKKLASVSEPTTGEGVDRENEKNLGGRQRWVCWEAAGHTHFMRWRARS